MKILVTGGTGFLGSAFVGKALAAGHELGLLVRPGAHRLPPSVRQFQGTLSHPPWRQIEEFAPCACLHSAWIATPGVYLDSPLNDTLATESFNFLARCCALGVQHLIALGSCAEAVQISPYSKAKRQLRERLLELPGLSCWARIFYPYGPGEHSGRLLSSLFHRLQEGDRVHIRTPHSRKDYIHIDDAAAALLRLLEARYTGEAEVGTGEGVEVGWMAREMANLLGAGDRVTFSDPPEEDALGDLIADPSALHSLGWRPEVSISEGLRRLHAHLQAAEQRDGSRGEKVAERGGAGNP